MNGRERDSIARRMAGILRHFPEKFDLEMDLNGWVSIRDLSNALSKRDRRLHWLRDRHIEVVVEIDEKGRYEVRGGMVRATYAHTVEIELDLPTDLIPDLLFYPCSADELDVLLEAGIKPGGRRWGYLSKTVTSACNPGRVHPAHPLIFEGGTIQMQADGNTVFRAGTTVYLAEDVPSEYCQLIADDNKEYELQVNSWSDDEQVTEVATSSEEE